MLMKLLFLINDEDFGQIKIQLKTVIISGKGLYFEEETSISLLFFYWFVCGGGFFQMAPKITELPQARGIQLTKN